MIDVEMMRAAITLAQHRWRKVQSQLPMDDFGHNPRLEGTALMEMAILARHCLTATLSNRDAEDLLDTAMSRALQTWQIDGRLRVSRDVAANVSAFAGLCKLALCS